MDSPIYHLERVVKARTEDLEDFTGPLDLILHLLSKNKMEIKDIQISLILDQYLAWMDQRKELDLEVASEFVTMASQLLYIKTRMLLSIHDEEALSEMEQLIATLEAHQRNENYLKIKEVVPQLDQRYTYGRDFLTKEPEPLQPNKEYRYVHPKEDLKKAMLAVLARSDHKLPPPVSAFQGIVGREPYPVAEKAMEILNRLLHLGVTRFKSLFRGSRSRSEVVATFLAVLELCKAKRLRLAGTAEDCTVTSTGESGPEEITAPWTGQNNREEVCCVELKEMEAALEAVLFAAGEPVGVERLCLGLETDRPTLDAVAQRLMDQYSYERRGIRLLRLDASYQLCSAPEYADYVRKTLESRKPARLSQPALEVLAIIAYYQPVTRAYVDQVRGVDSSYTVGLLLERDLIEESGRLAVPGRPILYRTTKTFLRSFGLSSLEELPELPSGTQEGDQMTLKLEEAVAKLKAEEAGQEPEGETSPEPAEGGTP